MAKINDDYNKTWSAKVKRTFTSVLPVAKNREGSCNNCGECCKLPNVCIFLKFKEDGESYCLVHPFKWLNCRKYPRTESEHISNDKCGYNFR